MTLSESQKAVAMTGDEAVAQAAKVVDPDVVAAYPITPQTIIVERFSDFWADGEVSTNFICVESEHSAMSACIGASAAGARVFTASASQGIMLMLELLPMASGCRNPIVMAVANRAINSPLNIHGEQTDQLMFRDTGWISMFGEDNQDAYDHTIIAFRIGEDPDVQLPVAYGLDGFINTHALEGVQPVSKELVGNFLPPRKATFGLDPNNPISVGLLALPDYYTEMRWQVQVALDAALKVIPKAFQEWGELTGRYYKMVESYKMEELCGIPTMFFEAEMADPRSFAEGPWKNRVDAFLELLEEKKHSK